MNSGKFVTNGLVLRQTATKESDYILTVLTAEGIMSVIAKGARSRRSRYSAACQFLAYSEMTVTGKGDWYYLNEAATRELFDGVRCDFEKLALASYFAELTEVVCREQWEASEMLSLLLNALFALGSLQKPQRLIKAAFTWRLLANAGFAPLVEGCALCGCQQPESPLLDVQEGIIRCSTCPPTSGLNLPLSESGFAALRHILLCPPKRLYSFTIPVPALRLLDNAAEVFCAAQLERTFRTLDYYKGILPPEEIIS
ncbi:MAG: DNA repair protein RecO [Oscillospiraceae bacterium]|nr:DNA repair protein RecO [Oscillospiraceae bacterium]